MIYLYSYDILGAGMLWKPRKARKFVKIRIEECFDKVLNEEFKKKLMYKMKNVITRFIYKLCTKLVDITYDFH